LLSVSVEAGVPATGEFVVGSVDVGSFVSADGETGVGYGDDLSGEGVEGKVCGASGNDLFDECVSEFVSELLVPGGGLLVGGYVVPPLR
jgi:hypothetical protein